MTEHEEYANTLVRTGFNDRDDVLEAVLDSYGDELSEPDAPSAASRPLLPL